MVALTSSLFVMLVAFYNLSMDKLSKEQILMNKANHIIDKHMPDYAKNSFDDVPDSYKEGFIIPEELRQKVEAEVLI